MTQDILTSYPEWVITTCYYPHFGQNDREEALYLYECLFSELGEVAGHTTKYLRNGDEKSFELLKKELGDNFFYIVRLSQILGLSLEELLPEPDTLPPLKKLTADEFQGMSAVFSESLYKIYLTIDDPWRYAEEFSPGLKEQVVVPVMKDALSRMVRQLLIMAHGCEMTLEDVLTENRAKIESRLDRGTLKGHGDER